MQDGRCQLQTNTLEQLIDSVASLQYEKLGQLLREVGQLHLVLSAKEYASLSEMTEILQLFADDTTLTQGEEFATLGCVVVVFYFKQIPRLYLIRQHNKLKRTQRQKQHKINTTFQVLPEVRMHDSSNVPPNYRSSYICYTSPFMSHSP